MRGGHPLDEGLKAFLDGLGIRVGEGIEHKCVRFDFLQEIEEVRLHFAVAAEAQGNHAQTGAAAELQRIGHTGTGDADALGVTGAVEYHLVTEGRRDGFDARILGNADFQILEFGVHRQVQHANLFAVVHTVN